MFAKHGAMSGFLFTLIAVVLAGIGARDQLTVAALAQRLGTGSQLLSAIAVSVASAALAAWAAIAIAPLLAPQARMLLAAMALAMAGGESLLLSLAKVPQEPTRSLGALAIVLFAHQLTDAARFLVFAIAMATAAPFSAGLGGAVGGAIVVTAGWLAPDLAGRPQLRTARRVIACVLLGVAALLALKGLGRA